LAGLELGEVQESRNIVLYVVDSNFLISAITAASREGTILRLKGQLFI